MCTSKWKLNNFHSSHHTSGDVKERKFTNEITAWIVCQLFILNSNAIEWRGNWDFCFFCFSDFSLEQTEKKIKINKISFNKNSDFLIDYFKIIILTASYLIISVLYVSFIVHSATWFYVDWENSTKGSIKFLYMSYNTWKSTDLKLHLWESHTAKRTDTNWHFKLLTLSQRVYSSDCSPGKKKKKSRSLPFLNTNVTINLQSLSHGYLSLPPNFQQNLKGYSTRKNENSVIILIVMLFQKHKMSNYPFTHPYIVPIYNFLLWNIKQYILRNVSVLFLSYNGSQ